MIMNDLKDVLRMTATVFLFVSFFGLLVYADETQEHQVERLIKLLQDQVSNHLAPHSLTGPKG